MVLKKLIKDMYNLIKLKQVVNYIIEEIKEAYEGYPEICEEIINAIRKTAEETKDLKSIKFLGRAYLAFVVRDALKSYFNPKSYVEFILDRVEKNYHKEIKEKIKEKKLENVERSLWSVYDYLFSIGKVAIEGFQWRKYLVRIMIEEIRRRALGTRDYKVIELMAETYLDPEFKEILWEEPYHAKEIITEIGSACRKKIKEEISRKITHLRKDRGNNV